MKRVKPTKFPDNPELRSAEQLGLSIRAMRTKSEMSLEDAAMTLGMSKQTLSDIELGKSTVSIGNTLKAASGLGVALFIFPSEMRELIKLKLEN